jgi:hypothetical protein
MCRHRCPPRPGAAIPACPGAGLPLLVPISCSIIRCGMRSQLRVRRLCSLSQTGCIKPRRPLQEHRGSLLTDVDDVTQDQPNPRALRTTVRTALASSASRLFATPPHTVSSERLARGCLRCGLTLRLRGGPTSKGYPPWRQGQCQLSCRRAGQPMLVGRLSSNVRTGTSVGSAPNENPGRSPTSQGSRGFP